MNTIHTQFNSKAIEAKKLSKLRSSSGFTLIEIMVSISIFTVVMMITIGALLTLNDGSRKAQALRTVIDNLNFAVEDITRKVKTGDKYRCYLTSAEMDAVTGTTVTASYNIPQDCASGGKAISLFTQNDEWVIYIYSAGGIKIRKTLPRGTTFGPPLDITSGEVTINSMSFTVRGSEKKTYPFPYFTRQPMVILNISGTVDLKKEKLRTDFSLQTAISHRGIGK